MAARKGTKASRSAAAKKAAATRKRNAAKRSTAAKKAAATRKRNARKPAKRATSAKRKASSSTSSKRSAAAKKAAATRKRNAAKRSTAAKKAAATRKRNSGRKKTSAKRTSSRSTAAKRSAAAKKAAATRKRNASKRSRSAKKAAATRKRNGRKSPARRKSGGRMTKAKRSAAAKKAWRTRRRNGTAKRKSSKRKTPARRRSRRKASAGVVSKAGKNTYDSAMKAVNALPGYALMGMYGALAIGAYNAIKPFVWDQIGVEGFVDTAASKIGDFTTVNLGNDIGNFTNKAIAVGTIAALGHLASSKKALNLIDAKLTQSAVGIAGLYFGAKFLSEINTLNLGEVVTALATGDFSSAKDNFMAGTGGYHQLGSMHSQNKLPMFGAHKNTMMTGGAHNNLGMASGNMGLMNQMQTSNTAALQMGGNKSGFFGTGKSLGATRVNLF